MGTPDPTGQGSSTIDRNQVKGYGPNGDTHSTPVVSVYRRRRALDLKEKEARKRLRRRLGQWAKSGQEKKRKISDNNNNSSTLASVCPRQRDLPICHISPAERAGRLKPCGARG